MGEKTSIGEGRKKVEISKRMFVDTPQEKTKQFLRGRFGLMCFSANRNKNDWERCECDHINGDHTDDREENVRWLLPPRTTKTTITTKEPGGLILHEFSHAWHSKFVSYQEINFISPQL